MEFLHRFQRCILISRYILNDCNDHKWIKKIKEIWNSRTDLFLTRNTEIL